jgi:putative membrane protein (TIGR04086 family)
MRNETMNGDGVFSIVKAVLLSLAVSLLASVVFAVILRAASWGEGVIYPVNQIVKVISIALGTLVFVRGEKGWLKGGLVGLLFTALSYLAFSALGGDFSLSWLIVAELFFGALVGGASGIAAVNFKS